ncbi:hypothetical protein, partial [Sphingomonas sp. GM_Shp_2]|uniref:hypothetical protein n=1 Tax=Sphingomonas sp. GM_Shp_2 TaxID=2937380 RepID=UPI00226AA278
MTIINMIASELNSKDRSPAAMGPAGSSTPERQPPSANRHSAGTLPRRRGAVIPRVNDAARRSFHRCRLRDGGSQLV